MKFNGWKGCRRGGDAGVSFPHIFFGPLLPISVKKRTILSWFVVDEKIAAAVKDKMKLNEDDIIVDDEKN